MRYFLIKTTYFFSLLLIFNHLNAEPPTIHSLIAYLEEGSPFKTLESFIEHFTDPDNTYFFTERLQKILFTSFPPVFKKTETFENADCLTPIAIRIYVPTLIQCQKEELFNTRVRFSLKLGDSDLIWQKKLNNDQVVSEFQKAFEKLFIPQHIIISELQKTITTPEYKYLSQNSVLDTLKEISQRYSNEIEPVVYRLSSPFYNHAGYARGLQYLSIIISGIIEYYGYPNATYEEFRRNYNSTSISKK